MMKQNAGKRIDNILIKLPESMRDRIEKLPAQTLQHLEESSCVMSPARSAA